MNKFQITMRALGEDVAWLLRHLDKQQPDWNPGYTKIIIDMASEVLAGEATAAAIEAMQARKQHDHDN